MHETPYGPSLTRGEYWLLEAAVEAAVPLCWLPADNLETILNKQGHGLERATLLETLDRLFSAGLIEAIPLDGEGAGQAFSRAQTDAALDERQGPGLTWHFYRLTAAGGRAWEEFARPDWTGYLDASYELVSSSPEVWRGTARGADRALLERYVAGLHYSGHEVRRASIIWGEHAPWQATYWKTLPRGYEATFDCGELQRPGWTWDDMPLSYWWIYQRNWYRWR